MRARSKVDLWSCVLCTLVWMLACSAEREPDAAGGSAGTQGAQVGAGAGGAAGVAAGVPSAGTTGSLDAGSSQGGSSGSAAPDSGEPGSLAMDECGLKTKYAGDEYCILPPPPDQGFQLHVGPSNYENPESKYILGPHQEVTSDFVVTSPNEKDVYFYYRQFRMRPGSHHNIVSVADGAATVFGMGRRIGTSNNLAEDSPKGGVFAPENQGVGILLKAKSQITVNLHSINTTDEPQLREVWINFWYRDADEVTEPVQQMFQTGSVLFAVQPHQDTILGPYSCKISGTGRMLWFYGHRHANNVRFSAWRVRGGQRDLFYEGYDWEETLVLEYASTVQNPTPNRELMIEGGWSGILDLMPGDVLEWECHVINKTDGVLRFTNNTFTGEMCIMDAELVGANCP